MLTIGKLGIGQENYYLEKVAEGAEDYYSGEGRQGIGSRLRRARLSLVVERRHVVTLGSSGHI
jgi:hypothetical protein